MPDMTAVYLTYTNHRGETARRHVVPGAMYWGKMPPWHPEPQWLLEVWDLDKEAERTFAMKGISGWEPAE